MTSIKNYSVPDDALAWLERIVFTFQGKALEPQDSELMRTGLKFQYALGGDLLTAPELDKYRSWLSQLQTLDVFQFGNFLSALDVKIKNYLDDFETGKKVLDYREFKQLCECSGYWGFVSPISQRINNYVQNPTAIDFKLILQWINFLRRINLRKIDLTDKASIDYEAFESDIVNWTYPLDIISEMNLICREWFSGLYVDETSFVPKHGPGSIADCKGRPPIAVKYSLMKTDMRLNYLKKFIGPLTTWSPFQMEEGLDRTSEIVCVPKSMTTNRIISKEPCTLQYFQQGVMHSLVTWIHSQPKLHQHIDFTNQRCSAEMACSGSIFGEFATIDLSAASDSVSHLLVKHVFKGTPILPFLVCTRSTHTKLPNGKIVELRKFAPMGSATCFPIETIIFSLCCELAKRRSGSKTKYRVFGDDIVVSRNATEELITILDACHFKMNASKSFWKSEILNFREACGGEYFNGVDVAPMRISRRFQCPDKILKSSADVIQSYMSMANEAFGHGLLNLRLSILDDFRGRTDAWLCAALPYTTSGNVGIQTFPQCCTNFRLKSRFALSIRGTGTNYQCREFKCILPKSSKITQDCTKCSVNKIYHCHLSQEDCDGVRYFEWLRLRMDNGECKHLVAPEALSICPTHSKMSMGWSPLI